MSRNMPPQDGHWWLANRSVHVSCTRCGHSHAEQPAAMAYVPDLDKRNEYPEWRATGWLAWWECPNCGDVRQAPTLANTVAAWGDKGWERIA